VTLTEFIAQRTKNEALEKELMAKTARVEAFQGLPAVCFMSSYSAGEVDTTFQNLDLARHELRVAKQNYRELAQHRQELLSKMAESMT